MLQKTLSPCNPHDQNVRNKSPEASPRKTLYDNESVSSDENSDLVHDNESAPLNDSSDPVIQKYSDSREDSSTWIFFCIVGISVVFAIFVYTLCGKCTCGTLCKVKTWESNIKNLKELFPSQDNMLWYSVQSGAKTIVTEKPVKPSVILLLHNDENTSECFVRKVAKDMVTFLSEEQHEPIIVNGVDMKKNHSLQQDYGLFAETHKDDLKEKHVMIVLNLQEIPAILARTFHSLCDEENPVVHEAVYLFTMNVEGNNSGKPTDIAENTLKKLWKDKLDKDILDPLITRITNTVLTLKSESNINCQI